MMTEPPTAPAVRPPLHHAAFFRQSGWLMIANILGGMMSFGVHFLSKKVSEEQYSVFGTLLMAATCLPVLPLQMVLAQQTASRLAAGRERQLAGVIRLAWFWTFALWAAASVVVVMFQGRIVARWDLASPVALWVTLLTVLVSLWQPVFGGVLQGRQDFFWFGWGMIIGSVGRLAFAALLVLALAAGETGMMTGMWIGISTGVAVMIWQTRDLWSLPREPFDRKDLLRQLTPLILGFWSFQILFTTDTLFAKAFFTGKEVAPYVAAGTLSRAVMWLVLPLAAVMFPKLVHSHVKAEKTNLLGIVLAGTAVLAVCGGLGLWIVGPWVVKFVWGSGYVGPTSALLPWYALAIVPLALANVLANDLLARGRFRVVPFMVLITMLYCLALPYVLTHYPRKLEHVLQTLAVFNLLFFIACAWAAFGGRKSTVGDVVTAD